MQSIHIQVKCFYKLKITYLYQGHSGLKGVRRGTTWTSRQFITTVHIHTYRQLGNEVHFTVCRIYIGQ